MIRNYILAFAQLIVSGSANTSLQTEFCSSSSKNINYVLFGYFCGECGGHCATMYQFKLGANENTFFMDTTDSYFNNKENVICRVKIADARKFELGKNISNQIPNELLNCLNKSEKYGCPDCHDQCGIYFEMMQNNETMRFYFDTDISMLDDDLKLFLILLKNTIAQLAKK
jgi:hypothetical protein